MIKILDIEKAVSGLPRQDLAKFRSWFEKFDALKWDNQLKKDIKSGKLDRLSQKALADFKKGKCKEL